MRDHGRCRECAARRRSPRDFARRRGQALAAATRSGRPRSSPAPNRPAVIDQLHQIVMGMVEIVEAQMIDRARRSGTADRRSRSRNRTGRNPGPCRRRVRNSGHADPRRSRVSKQALDGRPRATAIRDRSEQRRSRSARAASAHKAARAAESGRAAAQKMNEAAARPIAPSGTPAREPVTTISGMISAPTSAGHPAAGAVGAGILGSASRPRRRAPGKAQASKAA